MIDSSEFTSANVVGSNFDTASDIESLSTTDLLCFTSLLLGGIRTLIGHGYSALGCLLGFLELLQIIVLVLAVSEVSPLIEPIDS